MEKEFQAQAQVPVKTKSHVVKRVLLVLLVVAIVAASGGGTYLWQHGLLTDKNASLQAANKKADALTKQLGTAKTTLTATNAKLKKANDALAEQQGNTPAMQEALSLTVNRSTRMIYADGLGEYRHANAHTVAVSMTLTNNTKQPISIQTASFKLKDSDSNTYKLYGTGSLGSRLGSGYADLYDQTVEPGESVSGALEFQVTSGKTTSYTLYNESKAYPFTASSYWPENEGAYL
jgi:Tfp pilus assembly protein PilN